ncbi:MAG TPA: VCBS repeat-containing protein, partial [Motilibacteraceae bacterium]|nr:VCBS repeat-containing protein [Motilibacteraceae bacterium]
GWSVMSALTGVGDLSGDGRPDLLARDAAGVLWLYPGTADGSLGARTMVGRSGWSVMSALTGVGDLSGDRRPDLLARDGAGALWLYPGTAERSLGARTLVGRSGWQVMTALVGTPPVSRPAAG